MTDQNVPLPPLEPEREGSMLHHYIQVARQRERQLQQALNDNARLEQALEAQMAKFEGCPHPKGEEYWPCGCSYDKPSDVCAVHAPQLQQALNENAAHVHDLSHLQDMNNRLQVENAAMLVESATAKENEIQASQAVERLRTKNATLGWQKLTLETKWEGNTLVGRYTSIGRFVWKQWERHDSSRNRLYYEWTHYRRLNPPSQEQP